MKNTTTQSNSFGALLPMIFALFFLLFPMFASSQVGIGTTTPKAALEIDSPDSGILVPRIALTSTATAIPVTNPQGGALETSTLIYNTATVAGATGVSPGFYFWNGSIWVPISGKKGWSLTGDAATVQPVTPTTYGTTPIGSGENYVGTTDPNDLVFGSNSLERLRIKTNGRVGIGKANPTARLDVFTTNQEAAIRGETTSAVGYSYGVFGKSISSPGFGVFGDGVYAGVRGEGSSISANPSYGVMGFASGSNGTRIGGFFSANGGSSNYSLITQQYGGTVGLGTSTPNLAHLQVQGGIGNTVGMFNLSPSSYGISLVSDWPGIYFNSYYNGGVRQMASSGFPGFFNFDPMAGSFSFNFANIVNTTAGNLVAGTLYNRMNVSRDSGVSIGYNLVSGKALNVSSGNIYTDLASFYQGYVATVNGGKGTTSAGQNIGVEGRANHQFTSSTDKMGGLFYVSGYNGGSVWGLPAVAAVGSVIDNVAYKILGFGAVSTIVKDENEKDRIMVAPESPEALFQDYGTATLVNGKAKITFDPILAKNIRIDDSHPVKIFIQPEGKCNGLYVFNKTPTGFEVAEQENGDSDIPFSYQIVAYRADEERGGMTSKYSDMRFKPLKIEFRESKNEMIGTEKTNLSGMAEAPKGEPNALAQPEHGKKK